MMHKEEEEREHGPPLTMLTLSPPASHPGPGVKRKQRSKRRHHASSSEQSTTTEEEDTANCLILLAQGKARRERYTSRKYADAGGGLYVYECATCGRCFPTFQALGGHRASHKKPRLLMLDDAKISPESSPPTLSVHTAGVTSDGRAGTRRHECSTCGAEFASGQALGGHMRRHRPLGSSSAAEQSTVTSTEKESGSVNLELDLNLPAPPSTEEEMTSPAPKTGPFARFDLALLDCHH